MSNTCDIAIYRRLSEGSLFASYSLVVDVTCLFLRKFGANVCRTQAQNKPGNKETF